eukprot:3813527-Amphidinium_carterae.1
MLECQTQLVTSPLFGGTPNLDSGTPNDEIARYKAGALESALVNVLRFSESFAFPCSRVLIAQQGNVPTLHDNETTPSQHCQIVRLQTLQNADSHA